MEIEKDLLSAVFAGGRSAAAECIDIIADHTIFFDTRHQIIWQAIESLYRNGDAVDAASIQSKLDENLEPAGGKLYIREIKRHYSNLENVSLYAKTVKTAWQLRESAAKLFTLAQDIRSEDLTPDDVRKGMDSVYDLLSDASLDSTKTEYEALKDVVEKAKERFERGGALSGMPFFGIRSVDELIDGVEGGDVIIIAARPKVGKSSLINSAMKFHSTYRVQLTIVSGEMPTPKTAARELAAIIGLSTKEIEAGEFLKDEDTNDRISKFIEGTIGSGIRIGFGSLDIPRLRYIVRTHNKKYGTKRFIFDRIGLFRELQENPDHVGRAMVTAAMRELTNEIPGLVIVAASQLVSDAEKSKGRRPGAAHIFGGTGAQANCTKAMCIYRPEIYGDEEFTAGPLEGHPCRGMAEIYTVLNNYGDLGSTKVRFIGSRQFFTDFDAEESFMYPGEQIVDEKEEDLPF